MSATTATGLPAPLWLDDPHATDPQAAGAKAAKLAAARVAGLPTLDGFVIPTTSAEAVGGRLRLRAPLEAFARADWARLSHDGARPLVVRSSSTVEDAAASSMAGRFQSILDVTGWDGFVDAVDRVLASAGLDDGAEPRPMAVLVQPMLRAAVGGVLFGIDPVTGDPRHVVVEAVEGGPDALVSGRVTAARYVLDRRGRLVESDAEDGLLQRRHRRALARLARRTRTVFDGPQDVEWAFDGDRRLHLLQSRPVTATGAGRAVGPLLGPGPVGETFPDPLRPLEVDLWVEPLRRGVAAALQVAGGASEAAIDASPVITVVGGRVAADLELLGVRRDRPSPLERLDPRGPARHLAVAWRVGRLRAALPSLADDLLHRTDRDLADVPALARLTTPQVLGLIGRARLELTALHGMEVLVGMLLTAQAGGTAAGSAMAALARARADGEAASTIVERDPTVLALVAPRLGGHAPLPEVPAGTEHVRTAALDRREALRLRARWVQELLARAADELGARLVDAGWLRDADDLAWLRLAEIVAVVDGGAVPDLDGRRAPPLPPLPAAFRLTESGDVVPAPRAAGEHAGRGAGGGRRTGIVRHVDDVASVQPGDVLIVRTLEPHLAAVLPDLGGLVSETGSTLSHLAILARELQVPTVVGVDDALARFPAGATVLVDGISGEVTLTDAEVPT